MVSRLFLVRHGEAEKNLRDIHGGSGTSLTECGRRQSVAVANALRDRTFAPEGRIYYHPRPQVEESTLIICRRATWSAVADDRLAGSDLGVLAGLSSEEAAARFPHEARQLDLWRQGQQRIDELEIGRNEPVEAFERRIRAVLSDISSASDTDAAVVGTRSALIMIKNLLALGERFSYDCYEPYRIPNGELSVWARSGNTKFSHSETLVPLPSSTPY
jgi:broad specificity phosphatase PhoE